MSVHAPLLQNKPATKPSSVRVRVEEKIESSNTSHHQLLRAIFISFAWAFDSQQTFINIFTDSTPSWHCTHPDQTCTSSTAPPCGLPADSWAWDSPAHSSIISDWSLHCSPFTSSLPASSFFIGCLLGGILFSTLSDSKLGRKNMLLLSCLAMSLSSFLSSFSPNLYAYSTLRLISGLGRATIGTNALVLSTEIVEEKWRDRVSILGFFFFSIGFLSLPPIAYLQRNSSWRNVYLCTSIPSILYAVSIYFVAEESPRWLLVHGNANANAFSALETLYKKKWASKRLASVMFVGFGVGMVYYGMPLNIGGLGSNLYVSVAINALAELPSSLLIFFLIGKIDRRSSLVALTVVSGVTSLICVVFMQKYMVVVEVVSFFCACTAFDVLLIYSVELFPTCMRNWGVGMVRQAAVFGGVFAPLLVAEGRKYGRVCSFGVFGVMIGCCGMFVSSLPETRGSEISNTIEEEECKGTASSYVV